MNTTKLMIVGAALLMTISCDNTQRDKERKEAKDNLKSFVDSVDRVADDRADHNWSELDRRYSQLEQRAETAYINAEENDLEDLRKIKAKYEEAKIEVKMKEVEMKEKSEMHISRLEAWRESRTADSTKNPTTGNKNTSDDMDGTMKESVDWLEDNFEKLGNDMRVRYDRIRADLNLRDGDQRGIGSSQPIRN
jgi:hypothetical protein